ncbi:hypothetical protein C4577_03025 [Candidatus Parcubacteria bacterium]|nr:MAG: hypothetical protein C4577_03025 [Candidatus Parcubacteria bacterium]
MDNQEWFHIIYQIRKVIFDKMNSRINAEECFYSIFDVLNNNGFGFDNCEGCNGLSGGVPGNENVVDGKILCDYCSSKLWDKEKE